MARWQRERRQQTIIVTVFSAILFFTIGLVAWAATDRYYGENLKPALTFDGRAFAMRDYKRELGYQYTRFYVDYGVPPGYENDPQIQQQKATYEGGALEAMVEQAVLDREARADGVTITQQQIDERYERDFGEYHTRHILITPVGDDEAVRDATTKMEERYLPADMRGPELDELLWFEGRVGVEIAPERWLAWDQGKG
jgi:hypothetical protein